VRRCQELPGQELFQYLDDHGQQHIVDSSDVNQYLRDIADESFTAKDFRTWSGTVQSALALEEIGGFDSETQAKKNVVAAVKIAAKRLGNRPATCRNYYIHPAVLDAYMDGTLLPAMQHYAKHPASDSPVDLRREELCVTAILAKYRETAKRLDFLSGAA